MCSKQFVIRLENKNKKAAYMTSSKNGVHETVKENKNSRNRRTLLYANSQPASKLESISSH